MEASHLPSSHLLRNRKYPFPDRSGGSSSGRSIRHKRLLVSEADCDVIATKGSETRAKESSGPVRKDCGGSWPSSACCIDGSCTSSRLRLHANRASTWRAARTVGARWRPFRRTPRRRARHHGLSGHWPGRIRWHRARTVAWQLANGSLTGRVVGRLRRSRPGFGEVEHVVRPLVHVTL